MRVIPLFLRRSAKWTLLALALAGGLLRVSPLPAAEDAGTRSVFAFGAGNRALALGGAYAALATDAHAPVWNPGGLGQVERRQLLASHASLYGLGVSEDYASLALPSWRWGAGALTFRRLSVDGIERRDDRGVLLDSDLGLGETELALSYGRSLRENWSVGASLKLRQQSLVGLKANGVGVDVGLLTRPARLIGKEEPWAERLTWGLAVRNLVEPSLRLDQEAVRDPIGIRTGLAYELPFAGGRTVIAALDVEKTRGSSFNHHLGLELALHPLLSLRGGWNAGTPTAGCGIQWRQFMVDYVLESNELDTVHRFGLGVSFGPTMKESRAAALRAQEEEFRARLAESFRRREAERVSDIIDRARVLLEERRFDGALQSLAAVKALSPEESRIAELEAHCLRGKAEDLERAANFAEAAILYGRALAVRPDDEAAAEGAARCRARSEQLAARSAQIQDLFNSALDHFSAGDLPAARSALSRILEVSPEDEEARVMLRRAESAIQARLSDLVTLAGRFVGRGLIDVAADLIEQGRALDPEDPQLLAVMSQLRAAQERAAEAARPAGGGRAAPVVPQERPGLSDERMREIADLYQRGIQAVERGRADEALRYWEMVWMADPDFQNVAEYLKREYLLRGLESFSHGGLDEAVRLWEKALEIDPSDQKAAGYLARAREQLMRTRELLGGAE